MDIREKLIFDCVKLESKYATIYTIEEKAKRDGMWLCINGDTEYKLDAWTVETAVADYLGYDAYCRRMDFFYRAWGFYD